MVASSQAGRCSRELRQCGWSGIAVLLMVCAWCAPCIGAASSNIVSVYLEALAQVLPQPAPGTVAEIEGLPRRVLAIRSYLRVGEQLPLRWSWTEQQTRDFEGSSQHRQLLAAIAAVTARFEAENPGYSLFANTQVRSLELQLQRWNENPGVAQVADQLFARLERELRERKYPQQPDADSLQRCKAFLIGWRPAVAAPLAAPGLSAHGQLRAVDFQVRQGERIIAGTSISAVARDWIQQGWALRLEQAVSSLGNAFTGPLQSPNEPWHYSYTQ
jgi:hypothetical protein